MKIDDPETAALVLCGGRSSRMGTPKEQVVLADGRTMLQHVFATLAPLGIPVHLSIPQSSRDRFTDLGLPLIEDETTFEGPLAAIALALGRAGVPRLLVVCCDQPLLKTSDLFRLLAVKGDRPVFLRTSDGTPLVPFPGVYTKSILPTMREGLLNGERSPRRWIRTVDCVWVTVPGDAVGTAQSFNTREELRKAGLLPVE